MLAEWYRTGQLKLDYPVVTQTIGLGDVEAAFTAMDKRDPNLGGTFDFGTFDTAQFDNADGYVLMDKNTS